MSADFDTLGFANLLADVAGGIARRYFRTPVAVDVKPDASPVTLADKEIEAALRARIEETFPTHGILGEEMGASELERDYVWVIDPIDGTRAFWRVAPPLPRLLPCVFRARRFLALWTSPFCVSVMWVRQGTPAH